MISPDLEVGKEVYSVYEARAKVSAIPTTVDHALVRLADRFPEDEDAQYSIMHVLLGVQKFNPDAKNFALWYSMVIAGIKLLNLQQDILKKTITIAQNNSNKEYAATRTAELKDRQGKNRAIVTRRIAAARILGAVVIDQAPTFDHGQQDVYTVMDAVENHFRNPRTHRPIRRMLLTGRLPRQSFGEVRE